MRSRAVLIAGLAALAASAGCGPSGDLVDQRPDLSAIRASSELGATPEQAALSWWNTLRLRDAEAAVARFAPAARRELDLARLRRALRSRLGDFASHAEATVLYSERARGRVTVFMRLYSGPVIKTRVVMNGVTPLAVTLRERDGVWLIDNAAWLRKQVDNTIAIDAFNEKLRREALRQRKAEEEGK